MSELRELRREYQDTPIPQELGSLMRVTIELEGRRLRRTGIFRTSIACAAAAALFFVGLVNFSPATASAMSQVPVLKGLVRLVTFTRLSYEDETHVADVKVPSVQGLEDEGLEKSLNEKYLKESSELYAAFVERIGKEEVTPEALALFTNYKVKTEKDDLFVVESIVTKVGASAAESVRYDNIDLKNQIIITLPSLFKNDDYLDIITAEIKSQMRKLANRDEGIIYFIKGEAGSDWGFVKILPEQTFYINPDSKLVIVFDEYAVAPGSMGIVEFVIPTDVIRALLVSDAYIH